MSSTLRQSSSEHSHAQLFAGLERLAAEALAFIDAMLNPGRIIAEVEQMRALQTQAARIEAADPVLAAQLRDRAARIGLR
jgi:hypothetical protein